MLIFIITFRSTFERCVRYGPNFGSFWMARHFPGPYLSTPARSALSSSAVHFCFGAPMAKEGGLSENRRWKSWRRNTDKRTGPDHGVRPRKIWQSVATSSTPTKPLLLTSFATAFQEDMLYEWHNRAAGRTLVAKTFPTWRKWSTRTSWTVTGQAFHTAGLHRHALSCTH